MSFESLVAWDKIYSYAWYPGSIPKLSIRINRLVPLFCAKSYPVSAGKRERVGEILAQHLGAPEAAA